MYVCLCHGITSKEVNKALKNGMKNSCDLHEYFYCKPKCGKCLDFIDKMIASKDASSILKVT